MAAIVSGDSLGLGLTTLKTLGQSFGTQARHGSSAAQSYINVFNGNLILQERDDFLAARGGGYQAVRTYNSQGQFDDDNGDNWSTGLYRQQITLTGTISQAGSTLTRLERDGGQSLYRWDATQACYLSTDGAGAYSRIRVDATNYVWSDGANTVQETYARSTGRMASSTDAQGNRLDYSFDANGNLTRVANSNGEATCYDYSDNNLTQIRDITADGRVQTRTRYSYDAQNRLSAVIIDLTPADNSVADGRVYTTGYTYDGDSKRVNCIIQPDGSQVKFSYVQVNGVWRIASATDAAGQTTRYSYGVGVTTVTDALGLSTVYAYDAAGQLTSVTAPPVSGVSGVTRYSYNERGDVVQIVDAEGRTIDMAFDANGNQIRQQDAAGNLIERRYDARNQLVAETLANSKAGEAAQTTRYVYEAGNRNLLRFTLTAQGRVTEYRYDAQGQRTSVLQHGAAYDLLSLSAADVPDETILAAWAARQNLTFAQRTDMQYDARGQLSRVTTYDTLAADGTGSATGAATVQYVYDQTGLLLKSIAGNGGVTTYAYDGMGRLLAQDAQGQLTSTSYDDTGNSVATTAANGLTTTRLYDAAGRLLSLTQSGGGTTLGTTRYTYDAAGRLILTEDPLGNRGRILYDAAGRKVADIDAQGILTEYSYNRAGQLTRTRSYATPVAATLLTDSTGRALFPDLATVRPATTAADHVTWRTYDAAGRLSKEINALGAVTAMQYDDAGRVIGTTRYATLIDVRTLADAPADADIKPVADSADRGTRSFYEDGLLCGTLDAEGYLTEIVYDNAGQIIRQIRYATTTVVAQRASGKLADLRPAQNAAKDIVERTLRNSRGQAVGFIDAQGYLTETRFDANGNIARTIRYATPALTSSLNTLAAVRPAASAQDRVQSNDYDLSNRLLAQTDPQGSITRYRYDKVGNLIATDRAADTAEVRHILARYDLQGRLTGELNAVGAALLTDTMTTADIDALWKRYGVAHAYDAMGHRIRTTQPDGQQTSWIYNANGRLTHTINALGEVTETRYDSFGQVSATVQYGQRLANAASLIAGARAQLDTALAALRQDSADTRINYRYDSLGLLTERSDALIPGASTQRYYNSFGELIRQDRIDNGTGVARTISDTQQRDRRGQVIVSVADAGRTHLVTRTQYDAFGRAEQSTDARGNITATDYDRLGRQIALTDAIGGQVATVYDAFDRIVRRNDHGAVTSYRYDAATRSTVLTTPDNVTVVTTTNRHGQTQSVTDGRGNVTRFDYDANGNLITQTQGNQRNSNRYDASNRLIESTDADGRKVVLSYDAANRLITRTVDPGGLNLVTRTTYDARGRQIGVIAPNGIDTRFDYDSQGRLRSQTVDPDGLKLTTRTSYDADGNIISVTSPNGSVTQYRYDGAGRRVQETIDPDGLKLTRTYRYDAGGNLTHVTDANGNITRHAYDQMNRLVWTVNAQGAAQKTVYDGSSTRVVQQTRYANALANPAADAPLDIRQLDAAVRPDVQDVVTFYRYDAMGRKIWQVDASGVAQMFQTENGVAQRLDYDANGNVARRTVYATSLTTQQLALLRADATALPAPTANAATDNVQRSVYDANNRLRYSIDSAGAVTEQRYDAAGNVTLRVAYSKPVKETDMADDTLLAAALKKGADAASDMRTRLVYDDAGRLQFEINAQGGVTERRYDANGNVQQQIGYAALLPVEVQQGALTAATIKAALKSDAADRTSTTLYDAANRVHYQIDSLGYVTQQDHDANGNLGKTVRYATAATVTRNADGSVQLGALTTSAQDVTEVKHYDAANRLRFKIDGLGYVTENRYDNLGNITSIVNYSQALAVTVKRDDLADLQTALGIPVAPTPSKETAPVTTTPTSSSVGASLGNAQTIPVAVNDGGQSSQEQTIVAMKPGQERVVQGFNDAMKITWNSSDASYGTYASYILRAGSYDINARIKGSINTAFHLELYDWATRTVVARSAVMAGNGQWQDAGITGLLSGAKFKGAELKIYIDKAGSATPEDSFILIDDIAIGHTDPEGKRSERLLDLQNSYEKKQWYGNRKEFVSIAPQEAAWIDARLSNSVLKLTPSSKDRLRPEGEAVSLWNNLGYTRKGETITVQLRVKAEPGKAIAARLADSHAVQQTEYLHRLAPSYYKATPPSVAETRICSDGQWQILTLSYVSQTPQSLTLQLSGATYYDDICITSSARGVLADHAEDQPMVFLEGAPWDAHIKKDTKGDEYITSWAEIISGWAVDGLPERVQIRLDTPAPIKASQPASPVLNPVDLSHVNPEPIVAPVQADANATTAPVRTQPEPAPTAAHTLTRYTYDAAGNLIKSTDALGNSETYAYNALGQRTGFTNKLGATVSYLYDSRGNLRQTIDPLGFRTIVTYDSFNRRIRSSDQRTGISTYAYDIAGNLIAATDGSGYTEYHAYDVLRNRVSTTNKLGGVTRFAYDTLGRKTCETLPVTGRDTKGIDRAVVNQLQYDAFGNRIAVVEAAGLPEERTTRYTFDALGRPLTQVGQATTVYIPGTGWQTVSPTETTRYDSRGNIVEKADANGNRTRLFYDADNRVIAEVSATGTLTTRSFDAAGNVISQRIYGDTLPAATLQDLTDLPPSPVNVDNVRETRFVYDANNRLTETIQAQVGFAERNDATGNLTYAVGDLVTRTTYNALGQPVLNQDSGGRRSYLYYNQLGQKILSIDAAGYAISWQYDSGGNVTSQRAYAQRLPAGVPYTESTNPATLLKQWPNDTRDRVTQYFYDALGRLRAESRSDVVTTVNDKGQLVDRLDSIFTQTGYNAMGDVASKRDALGNVTQWEYDLQGRKTGVLLPVVTDYAGKAVRQTTRYQYNGLHQVVRETQEGNGGSDAARVITHQYDQAGRRTSQTLASGDVIRYGYDAQGNTTAEIIDRKQADGSTVHEMTSIAYDAAGREIRRAIGSADASNNPTHNADSLNSVRYDAYGNIVGKQTATGNALSKAQQFTDYDAAGRIWRSNVDGGITKVYFYDRNGRPTVSLQSQTLDLRSMTLEQIQKEMGKADSQIATTVTVYDARGQAIQTIQPKMTSNRPNAALMALQGGGTFEGVQLTSGTTLTKGGATGYVQNAPAVADSVGVSGNISFSAEVELHKWGWLSPGGRGVSICTGVIPQAINFNAPDMQSIYGSYQLVVEAAVYKDGQTVSILQGGTQYFNSAGNQRIEFDATAFMPPSLNPSNSRAGRKVGNFDGQMRFSLNFYAKLSNGTLVSLGNLNGGGGQQQSFHIERYPAQDSGPTHLGFVSTNYGVSTGTTSNSNLLRLSNQTLAAASKVDLYYRPQGSTGPYAKLATSTLAGQSGTYVANMAGLTGNYDMLMVAVDKDGKLLRSDRLNVNRANNTVSRASGVANNAVFEGNTMHLAGLQLGNGKLATALTYKLNTGVPVTLRARDGIPGLFDIPVGVAAANLELVLTAADGSTDNLVGSIDPAKGVTNLQFLKYADSSLVFNNIDKTATRLDIRYREEGKTDWITKTLTRTAGNTTWLWDTQSAGLVPDKSKSYRYEVQFDAYDADGAKVNNGSAAIAAGNIAGGSYTTASITGSSKPRWVGINPNTPSAATLAVRYRLKGSTDAYTTATLPRLASGSFKLDTSALPLDQEYEFSYDARDVAGKTVASSTGYFRSEAQQQVSDGTNVQWMIGLDDDLKSETQVKRSQSYDAFGNIVSETDGNGNTVEFEYNTLGQLVLKRDAATDITLENGYIARGQRTETRYSYDAAGNLVGTRDANGNLNTQSWNMGGVSAQVSQEWHADGGIKKNAYDVFGNLRNTVNEDGWQTDYRYDANNRRIAMDRPVSAGVKATDRYELDVKGQRIAVTNALGYRSSTRYDSLGRVVETINAEGRKTAYSYTYDNTIAGLGGTQTGGWRRIMTDANGRTMTDDLDTTGRVLRHIDLGGRVFSYTYNYSGLIARQSSTNGQDIDYRYYGNGYLKNVIDRGVGTTATYEYDNNGNRTFEGYMADNGQFAFQQQTVSYDAKNRVVSIRDPRYDITYEYDALGNRRHMRSVYTNGLGTELAVQDYWYRYDSMSRFTISMGQLSGARATAANGTTTIVRGAVGDGVAFTYTQAGLRASASYARSATTSEHTESYYYDGRGLLTQTRLSDGSSIVRTTDLGGRVVNTKVTDGNGKALQNTTRTWTKDNQLLQEHDNLLNKGTKYELLADGTVSATQTYSADAKDTQLRTTFSYDWWDSAKQTSISVQARNSTVDSWKKVWQPGFSHFTYDVNGHSKLAYDEAGKRAFTYWTDTDGQVLKRQELIGGTYDAATGKMNGASKAREHSYYYLDSHRIGDVGNDQTERTDYAQDLAAMRSNDGRRSYEKFAPSNAADFDANYQPINSDYPAATPAAYTVRAGDTLQSVARAMWGDASLWYLLAEANGLIGTQPSAALTANTTLVIPNQVTNVHNTSATFKPYNPGKALGDTMPTLPSAPPPPPPPSKGGCGGLGSILTIVVVIVATVFTAGAALAALAPAAAAAAGGTMAAGMAALTGAAGLAGVGAAAIGAAVGSMAGQGFAIASGQQDSFSWRNVGLSALGGALSAGVGSALQGSSTMAGIGQATNQMGQTMAQAAIGNIATQGIMTASGLQSSFDWRGVAASAAAAGVGYAVGKAANTLMNYNPQANGQGFDWGKQFAGNTVSGMAAGATYAKLHGDEINAGRLIAGSAVYGAVSASVTEQRLMNAQREVQQTAMQRALNAPGMTEAGYWNQSRNTADQYADTFGGSATATRGPRDRLKLGGSDAEVEAIALQRRANDLAETLNDRSVASAMREGRDLAPTVANAAALGLLETFDRGAPRPFATPDDPQWAMDFRRGYADPNDNYGLGVMSSGITAAQMAGQFVGGTVDAFTQMGRGMIGANSGNAAYADFAAGRYVQGTLHSMQAMGEAGMTVMGLGGMAPAARSTMSTMELAAVRGTLGANSAGAASQFVTTPTRAAVRELRDFGLDSAQRRAFFEGKQVLFEDPSTAFETATIFKLGPDTLHAGVYDMISDGSGAVLSFANRSRSLANSLGVNNLELFGADIQNAQLRSLLVRRGFEPGAPVKIDGFGFNKYVETLRKTEALQK